MDKKRMWIILLITATLNAVMAIISMIRNPENILTLVCKIIIIVCSIIVWVTYFADKHPEKK